jgi:hypothetical protein
MRSPAAPRFGPPDPARPPNPKDFVWIPVAPPGPGFYWIQQGESIYPAEVVECYGRLLQKIPGQEGLYSLKGIDCFWPLRPPHTRAPKKYSEPPPILEILEPKVT